MYCECALPLRHTDLYWSAKLFATDDVFSLFARTNVVILTL